MFAGFYIRSDVNVCYSLACGATRNFYFNGDFLRKPIVSHPNITTAGNSDARTSRSYQSPIIILYCVLEGLMVHRPFVSNRRPDLDRPRFKVTANRLFNVSMQRCVSLAFYFKREKHSRNHVFVIAPEIL